MPDMRLAVAAEVRTWLIGLRADRPEAARLVGAAVVALLTEGTDLGPPLVVPVESMLRTQDLGRELDLAYQRQLEMLQKVRRGVADVATSRKRLELQIDQLERQQNKLTDQAEKALQEDREDLAREARARRAGLGSQLNGLRAQYQQVQEAEEKLTLASQRLQAKVDSFRTRKETVKAALTVRRAIQAIIEAAAGLGELFGEGSEDAPMPDPQEVIAGARAALDRYLTAFGEVERELEEAGIGDGAPPQDLMLLRPAVFADDDVRVLFTYDSGEAMVVLLAAAEGRTERREWSEMAISRSRALLGGDTDSGFVVHDKELFVSELFPGDASVLDSGAADLVGQSRSHGLAAVRRKTGLTVGDVARRMDTNPQRVADIERAGLDALDVGTLAAYLDALGGRLEIIADLGAERMILD
jgi:hypothetical protein